MSREVLKHRLILLDKKAFYSYAICLFSVKAQAWIVISILALAGRMQGGRFHHLRRGCVDRIEGELVIIQYLVPST